MGDEEEFVADFGIAQALSTGKAGMFGGDMDGAARCPECVRGRWVDWSKPVVLGRHALHHSATASKVPAEIGRQDG